MEERVRLAFTIGYIGKYFHGSQIQPDVKTVQGELIRVFTKLKWLDDVKNNHNLVLSSRTDAGVNVRRNGGVVTLQRSLWDSLTRRKMIRAVDDRLCEGLVFLDVQEVNDAWNPRIATHRVYRYRLDGMQSWEYRRGVFEDWLNLFVGNYDARNFSRLEEGKNPLRSILSCTPWYVNDKVIGFEIIGESFLWNQVRRIAMAVYRLSIGDLSPTEVKRAIDFPLEQVDFGVAPPEWLVLWDVVWPNLTWNESTHSDYYLTPKPDDEKLERTMFGRWVKATKLEMESILYHQWSILGKLPYVPHNSD